MLYRHTFVYLIAQVVASLLGFASLAVFTHLANPAVYGLFRVVMTGALLAIAVLFQWLGSSTLRFSSSAVDAEGFKATVLGLFIAVGSFTLIAGVAVAPFLVGGRARWLLGVTVAMVLLQAWFGLNLSFYRAQLRPLAYGRLTVVRVGLTLLASSVLLTMGYRVWGLLGGAILGLTVPLTAFARPIWLGVKLSGFDRATARRLLSYGLPLSASLSLGYIVEGSDRLLIGWLRGTASTGIYSAGYDLVQNALGAVMGIVNSAAFPLAVNALERGDTESARRQLEANFSMLFAIALPGAAGLAIVSSQLAHLLVGVSFQSGASEIMPWVALGVFISGVRAFYVDHAFQLANRTGRQVVILGLGAITNVLLNLLLIPKIGMLGAAYSTVAAYAVALIVAIALSRHVFRLPLPIADPLKVVAATGLMVGLILPFRSVQGLLPLALEVGGGASTYFVAMVALDGLGMRAKLVHWVRTRTE